MLRWTTHRASLFLLLRSGIQRQSFPAFSPENNNNKTKRVVIRTITLICSHTVCPQIASHNPSCEEASHTHKKKDRGHNSRYSIRVRTRWSNAHSHVRATIHADMRKKKEDQAKEAEESSTNNNNSKNNRTLSLRLSFFFFSPPPKKKHK